MFRKILSVAVIVGLAVGCENPQGGLFGDPEELVPDVPAAPAIVSVAAEDLDNGDIVLSNGDILTIVFDMDTNEPPVVDQTDIAGLLDFGLESLGDVLAGTWSDARTLVITVVTAGAGDLAIGSTVSVVADGTDDLNNAADTSAASVSSGTVTGDWGSTAPPAIVSVVANDPDDGDDLLSDNDTLTITFDRNTNEPSTTSDFRVNDLIDFGSSSLGADLIGAWSDPRTLVITVLDATGGDLANGDTILIRADGTRDLRNESGTSAPSTASGTVAGDWGNPTPPSIVSVTANDSDDADAVLSDGDTLVLVFDRDTNQPAASDKAEIDGLISFGSSSLGTDYTGTWSDAATLLITVVTAGAGDLSIDDAVTIIADGTEDLLNSTATSAASTATGNVVGDWGIPTPGIVSVTANDPGDEDAIVSPGDTLTIVFDLDTNQPAAATQVEIDDLIDFGANALGTDYTGVWSDARTLTVTVVDGDGGVLAIGDTIQVLSDGNEDLTNAAGTSGDSTSSAPVGGDWGLPVPTIASVTAADASGSGAGIQADDTLRIVFDIDTNEPAAATKAEIDGLVSFGAQSLGADYTGIWVDAQSLLVTVVDATGANLAVGDTITVIADGAADLTDAAGTSAVCSDSGQVAGDWGMAEAPAIVTALAWDWMLPQAGLNDNDRLTITFNIQTNQPAASNNAEIDGLIDFGGKSLGTTYSGVWLDRLNLEITVDDATGGDLAPGDVIRIIADGIADLTDRWATSPVSTAACTVTGNWSVVP